MSSEPAPASGQIMPGQITLPGQTHTAEGPHDQTGTYLMHFAFRRDLETFVRAARATPPAEAEVWGALAARWGRFEELLHLHHTLEDTLVWPVLLAHADAGGHADDRAALDALAAQHDLIDPAVARCHDALDRQQRRPAPVHRDAVEDALVALREVLTDHLQREETEALPILQRTVTPAEFARMDAAIRAGLPPRLLPFVVPWALSGLPDALRDRLLADAGPAYARVHRHAHARFARDEALAFRHV